MTVTATKSFAQAPLILLAVTEAAVLSSSVYFAGFVYCRDLMVCEYVVGPAAVHVVIIAATMLISLIAVGLYRFHQRMLFREVIIRLFVGITCGSLVLAAVFYVVPSLSLSGGYLSVIAIYSILLLSLLRFVFLRNIDQNIFRRKTLIFGSGERASRVGELRRRADRRGFKVVGTVPTSYKTIQRNKASTLETDCSLLDTALRLGADEIVIALDDRRGKLPIRELLDCRLHGIEVIDLIEFLERETGKIRVDLVSPGWLIFSEGFRKTKMRLVTKRVMDLFISITALIVAWPVLLVIACAIKLKDGWRSPVLYRQERVGCNGDLFEVLKFRSMIVDAEEDGRAVWATQNDMRITNVGRFIRKSRLDELPQVFNVILGQMSIVGPRPERPEFVEQLSESIPYYAERHTVKPGITGWAQLKYSYGASEEDAVEKLHYDLYYVKNHTLLLDLVIILQTVEVILWAKGAR